MIASEKNTAAFKKIKTIKVDIQKHCRADGTVILHSSVPLEPHPYRLTERLLHWADATPDKIFLGQRATTNTAEEANSGWDTITYSQTLAKVKSIAKALLNKNISASRPLVILSENSIEHALIALAALHIGIPYSPVTPAYSLRSNSFDKLKHVINLLTPGLIFVQDAKKYETALQTVAEGIEIIAVQNNADALPVTLFDDLLSSTTDEDAGSLAVDLAFNAIQPDTIAKILFTSGSTGLPKGVINTHENISTNWQQIAQTFPFLMEEGLEIIDWLPWNHTFGGNHNFGITLYNGGSLYIDEGSPTPHGIAATIANLKERKPTIYFNVPKGFEDLLPYFKTDEQLRKQFFSNLKMLFYAAAALPQFLWNEWEALSMQTTGERVMITTGFGSTETCPSVSFTSEPGGFAGWLGVPVPGLELKIVARDGKSEARYRGKNVFPGYWRQPELTANVFDEEGFYCSGDALRFVDESDANKGMIFDGRITEDFKLNNGTWVNVGILRTQIIAAGNGLIKDVVLTGYDNEFIGAIVFAAFDYCKHIAGLHDPTNANEIIHHPRVKEKLADVLQQMAEKSTGSSTFIKRALFAGFTLSIDKGEITDKGSINQRMVIQNYPEVVQRIYSPSIDDDVVEVRI
ncbi:MAG: feruloyl-CoA synthase [Panacibacter sp.]